MEVTPTANTGVLTVGVVVTVWVAVPGPLQPAALAVIIELPLHVGEKVTVPVAASMEFPAAVLAASRV